jgi:hypothetical protein
MRVSGVGCGCREDRRQLIAKGGRENKNDESDVHLPQR